MSECANVTREGVVCVHVRKEVAEDGGGGCMFASIRVNIMGGAAGALLLCHIVQAAVLLLLQVAPI